MDLNHKVIAKINDDKCLQCGRCYTACLDSGYQAIEFPTSFEVPKVIKADCTGCALCVNVCPVEDAIHMVKA